MIQSSHKPNVEQQITAPFHAKSAGVSLIAIIIVSMYYFANLLNLQLNAQAIPAGALNLVISAVVIIIVIEVALQIVLFIGAGQIEKLTDHDKAIGLQASRNAYLILTVGVMATFASLFIGVTPFVMGNILLLAFLLAEVVKYSSQLWYTYRSA